MSIASEILTSRLDNIAEWSPELLYRAFILADICCRDAIPRLLLNTRARLQTDDNLGDYREDFSYVCRYRSSQLAASALAKVLDGPLRIAVCISGQLRGYKQAFPTWHFLGLVDHHVCYVVHTLKDVGGGLPIPPKDARVLSGSFLEAYRAAWNEFGQEAMFSRYPGLFGLWAKDGGVADKGELIAFYSTEFVTVEGDIDGYAAAYGLTQDAIMGTRLRHFPANFMAHRNVAFSTLYSGVTVNSQGISCSLAPAYGPSSESILSCDSSSYT